jgi:hypothetical protein
MQPNPLHSFIQITSNQETHYFYFQTQEILLWITQKSTRHLV